MTDLEPFDGEAWESRASRRASLDQTRRRDRGRRGRWRRRIFLGLAALGIAIAAAALWLVFTGLQARKELQAVRSEVQTLRRDVAAGDLSGARTAAADLRRHAARAHYLTTGPIWSTAAAVPYLGDPLATARTLSVAVDRLAGGALPQLVDATSTLDPKRLQRTDGSFNLDPLARLAPLLERSLTTMHGSFNELSSSSGATWLGAVNSARADLLAELPPLIATVSNADVAVNTIPPMLGADGPKRYLVSFQNEAELRGLGGLPGAYAILVANDGRLRFTRFGLDTTLHNVPADVNLGADYRALYSPIQFDSTLYVDSNLSPHFPYSARIWAALWRNKTGQRLDGAVTLDPTAISYLLAVTGPAHMPDGTVVSAQNVVSLTQQTAYDRFASNNVKRKHFLLNLARAVSKTLIRSRADPTGLVRAAAKAATEHRLLVWSADPSLESQLAPTPIAGQVPETFAPYAGLAINNEGANKLDYYLHTTVDWSRSGCGAIRDVSVTIRLTNDASAGLPSYVMGSGKHGLPPPGTNRSQILYFATNASVFTGVTLNGEPTGATSGRERGHPAFGVFVDTPVGSPQTIVLHLREPAGTGTLVTRMQPMINPVQLTVHDSTCSS